MPINVNLTLTSNDLNEATDKHFPHYSVQLPEGKVVAAADYRLTDNVAKEPPYVPEHHPLACTTSLKYRLRTLKGRAKGKYKEKLQMVLREDVEDESAPNTDTTFTKNPHPGSDTRHVDPGPSVEPFRTNFTEFMAKFQAIQDSARIDGELMDKFARALLPLQDGQRMLAANPEGMRRLRLIFQWALCQVVTLFGEINAALDDQNTAEYDDAREAYLQLMRDLDDHEPQTTKNLPVKKNGKWPSPSGYGRSVKWAYIVPLIHDGRIKGAKVIAKWNPHISSSGIPIPHS